MWCKHCQQDVAGIKQPQSHQFGCARCGQSFAPMQPLAPMQAPRTSEKNSIENQFATRCEDLPVAADYPLRSTTTTCAASLPSAPQTTRQLRSALEVIDSTMQQLQSIDGPITSGTAQREQEPQTSSDSIPATNREASKDALSLEEACAIAAGQLREISSAELPVEIPSGPPAIAPGRKSIEALDREIRAVEEVLRSWLPRPQRRADSPSKELVRHFGKGPEASNESRRRIGFRSQVIGVMNDLKIHERQLGLAIFLNILLLCVIGSLASWATLRGNPIPLIPIEILSITAVAMNLLAFAWFNAQARSQREMLEEAEQENEWSSLSRSTQATEKSPRSNHETDVTASHLPGSFSSSAPPAPYGLRSKAQSVEFSEES